MQLTKNQIRHLLQIGHNTKTPLMRLGDKGLSESFIGEADNMLVTHELIKIRISEETRELREGQITALSNKLNASLVQKIGKMCLLYRRNEKKPLIALPSK